MSRTHARRDRSSRIISRKIRPWMPKKPKPTPAAYVDRDLSAEFRKLWASA